MRNLCGYHFEVLFFLCPWQPSIKQNFYFNSFLTDDDTRSICGQCRSISDCTEHAVWSTLSTFSFKIITNSVSILGPAIAGFTHFFQRSRIFFFQTNAWHSRIKIEWCTSAFCGKTLTFFKIQQKFIHATQFLSKSHTCILLSTKANLQFERVTSLYKYDRLKLDFLDDIFTLSICRKKNYDQK